MTSILWFRRDLRLHDLPALTAAMDRGPVAPLFVFDDSLIHGRWPSSNRTAFMLACLAELDGNLRTRGNRLHVRSGNPAEVVPRFAAEVNAGDVIVSRDYSPYSRKRDAAVRNSLDANRIGFHPMPGTLVHEPEDVQTAGGAPYSVFTPFFRKWIGLESRGLLDVPATITGVDGIDAGALPQMASLSLPAPTASTIEPGEAAALNRLSNWASGGVAGYGLARDNVADARTSRLSQDLRWGTLSPLSVLHAVGAADSDREKFISEIAWRDFYYHVIWHHPRVLRGPFQRQFARVHWDDAPSWFEAWKAGRTGYPIVDAAMRELLATGFMHNRARMIVASFLTKDLHIDWRLGEAHFMEHLIDGDVASNNGGWQWAASTGTDAQPYFRIFNPLLQAKRFDPDGEYIRRWLPELANVPGNRIHEPSAMTLAEQHAANCVVGKDYPAPIVDHSTERERAISLYAEARAEAKRSG